MTAKKKIMREFALDEISAVTKPAQKGARMVIMKRDGGEGGGNRFTKEQIAEMIAKGSAVLTGETDGHTHLVAIDDYTLVRGGGTTSYDDSGHTHPFTVDSKTGAVALGAARGHTHTAPSVVIKTDDTSDPGKDFGMTPEQMAELLALAGMNDAQKSHYGKLDAAGKADFIKLDHAGKDAAIAAEVAKAKGGEGTGTDSVIYTTSSGVAVRKSDGDVVLALAKQNDTLLDALKVTKEQSLAKEAEALAKSWTHIGKPHEEKVAMAKGILELPDVQKKAALEAMDLGKAAMSPMFKTFGALGGVGGSPDFVKSGPVDKLNELAKAHATKAGVDFFKAYDAVIQTEEGKSLYAQSLSAEATTH